MSIICILYFLEEMSQKIKKKNLPVYWYLNFEQTMFKFNLIASSRDAKRPAEHQGRLSFFAGGNKATMHI